LSKNPNGKVPLLEDGDLLLWESIAIMRYLCAKKTGAQNLIPAAVREQADVDRWLAWQLAHLSPAMSKVAFERIVKKLTGQGAPDQALIDAGTEEFKRLSTILDGWLESREYVAGRLSIADFALASHYSIAPAAGLEIAPYKRLSAWLERILSRASMKRVLAEAQAVM